MTGSWDDLALRVAARMPRLADGDTIILSFGRLFTQLQQCDTDYVQVESVGDAGLPEGRKLTPEQRFQLRELGWLAPDGSESINWWTRGYWPLAGRDAARLAGMMTASLRDVYRVPDPDKVQVEAFNAFTQQSLSGPV